MPPVSSRSEDGVYLYRIYDQTSQLGYLPVAGSFLIRAQAKDLTDTHLRTNENA